MDTQRIPLNPARRPPFKPALELRPFRGRYSALAVGPSCVIGRGDAGQCPVGVRDQQARAGPIALRSEAGGCRRESVCWIRDFESGVPKQFREMRAWPRPFP